LPRAGIGSQEDGVGCRQKPKRLRNATWLGRACHTHLIVRPLVTLHDELMSSGDEHQPIRVVELLRDVLRSVRTWQEGRGAGRETPGQTDRHHGTVKGLSREREKKSQKNRRAKTRTRVCARSTDQCRVEPSLPPNGQKRDHQTSDAVERAARASRVSVDIAEVARSKSQDGKTHLSEGVPRSSGGDPPAAPVVRVRPHQVAHRSLVGHLIDRSINRPNQSSHHIVQRERRGGNQGGRGRVRSQRASGGGVVSWKGVGHISRGITS